jgi:hypothetical protein
MSTYIFSVYFFTIVNNGTAYVVSTMPVDSEKTCIEIVKSINTQPRQSSRSVRATCHITKKGL